MTKPREKTREELQAEIEDGKKKIRQFEKPLLTSYLFSVYSKKTGRSKAILRWVAWEIKPLCAFSLTARTSRPYISALTATKPETTLAAALWLSLIHISEPTRP